MGWPYPNYPYSVTTVTTTPILSPIPGPMPYSYKIADVDIAYVRFHILTNIRISNDIFNPGIDYKAARPPFKISL